MVTPSLDFLFTDEMEAQHLFGDMKISEVDWSSGPFKEKAHPVSFCEKQYQHNTGNKRNIMAVLSMP